MGPNVVTFKNVAGDEVHRKELTNDVVVKTLVLLVF